MLENVIALSAATTAAVEFIKSVLLSFQWYANLNEQAQSAILQFVAFIAGILAAYSANLNILTGLPGYAALPGLAGVVLTGLIVGTGSTGIHIILALLGVRAGVTAATPTQMANKNTSQLSQPLGRRSYAPWA